MPSRATLALVAAVAVFIAFMIGYSLYQAEMVAASTGAIGIPRSYQVIQPYQPLNVTINVQGPGQQVESVYSRVIGSIVMVSCIAKTSVATLFGPMPSYEEVIGSGFFVSYGGRLYVVTNYHVVDGAVKVAITLINGTSYPATVVGTDPYSDLAVLSVDAPLNVTPLRLANSDNLRIGETVLAVGSPYGLAGSLTVGVVSQLGRSIQESTVTGYPIADLIQTSAPINPGNSGGPLLDLNGDVVGVNTAIIASSQGIGFAIPSDIVARELPYLVKYGHYDLHPWLGVEIVGLDYFDTRALGLPANVTSGVEVVSVVPGGPAARAGLVGANGTVQYYRLQVPSGGDVIIAINGTRVTGVDSLTSYMEANVLPGQTVVLTVVRDGRVINVPVIVGSRPPPSDPPHYPTA
ncbi:MAG: S1C family serine protease [Conexivisphaera sp.]